MQELWKRWSCMGIGRFCAMCCTIALLHQGTAVSSVQAAGLAGVACQQTFENDWADELNRQYEMCHNLVKAIGNVQFYWNLVNAKPYIEDTQDYHEADSVDLFFIGTHGGVEGDRAVWGMWNDWSLAESQEMRLGDDNRRLSIFSSYACYTMKLDNLTSRYRNIMRGGLRFATGSHDTVWTGWTLTDVGEDYANNLKDGDSIRYAWKDGISDWYKDQDAAVLTTGRTSEDCNNRLSRMTWKNYTSFPRLPDNSSVWYCWTYWSDL